MGGLTTRGFIPEGTTAVASIPSIPFYRTVTSAPYCEVECEQGPHVHCSYSGQIVSRLSPVGGLVPAQVFSCATDVPMGISSIAMKIVRMWDRICAGSIFNT